MNQYTDRPKHKALSRATFLYRYPRTAYTVSLWMSFSIALLCSVPVWIAGFKLWQERVMTGNHDLLTYAVYLSAFTFVSIWLFRRTRRIIRDMDASDIASLGRLQESNGVFWATYGQSWANYFPELAEKINPSTGNIDKNYPSSVRKWETVELELDQLVALSKNTFRD